MVSSPGHSHIRTVQAAAEASQGRYRSPRTRTSLTVEAVADTADGLDRRVRLQLVAQPADADLHDIAAGVEVQTPDVVQQLLTAAHVPATAHQVRQQRELALG